MSLLPLHNATLTLVVAVGSSADYDRDPVTGSTKFSGQARVFWRESVERVAVGVAMTDVLVEQSMLVEPSIGVAWAQGDIVTVTRDGEVAQTATVKKFTTSGTDETGRITRVVFEDG